MSLPPYSGLPTSICTDPGNPSNTLPKKRKRLAHLRREVATVRLDPLDQDIHQFRFLSPRQGLLATMSGAVNSTNAGPPAYDGAAPGSARFFVSFGLVQGNGVISTAPPGTTATRNSCPASSRMPTSASSPTADTSTDRQPPFHSTSAA
jgi:hypothetical protein